MRSAGPVEADRLLAAFEQSTDEALGLKLVNALAASPALSSLRVDALKAHLAKYGPPVQKQAEALYARLNADAAKQKAQLEQLMAHPRGRRRPPRPARLPQREGRVLLLPRHRLPRRQRRPRPHQDRLGPVRSRPAGGHRLPQRQPGAQLRADRRGHPATARSYNGLIRGENADELLLATGVNQEARIARREIEEMRPSTVSVMPAGLDQQLTPQELADLVAFLKACK